MLRQRFHNPPERVCQILRPITVEGMATWDDHQLRLELLGQRVRNLFLNGLCLIGEYECNRHSEVGEVFGVELPTRKGWAFNRENRVGIA